MVRDVRKGRSHIGILVLQPWFQQQMFSSNRELKTRSELNIFFERYYTFHDRHQCPVIPPAVNAAYGIPEFGKCLSKQGTVSRGWPVPAPLSDIRVAAYNRPGDTVVRGHPHPFHQSTLVTYPVIYGTSLLKSFTVHPGT
jgi:hypothetical protein